jgi:ubiquitin-like 1-activating enzyme E1 B
MAGNIIHAVATTNALVAGLLVVEAVKLLAGTRVWVLGGGGGVVRMLCFVVFGCLLCCTRKPLFPNHTNNTKPTNKQNHKGMPGECAASFAYERVVWSGRRRAPTGTLINPLPPPPPRAGCIVCGRAQLHLTIDTRAATLAQLLDKVVRRALAVNEPYLLTAGGFCYEEGDGLEEDEAAANAALLPRALVALPGGGVGHGSVLTVMDSSQGGFTVELVVTHAVMRCGRAVARFAFAFAFAFGLEKGGEQRKAAHLAHNTQPSPPFQP